MSGGRGWRDMRQRSSTGRGGVGVKVTLFITALFGEILQLELLFLFRRYSEPKHLYPVSSSPLLYLSTSLSLVQSLHSSLFADAALSGLLMRCQRLRWNGGGAREMPLKKLIFRAERSSVSVCSKASHLLATAPGGGTRRECCEQNS